MDKRKEVIARNLTRLKDTNYSSATTYARKAGIAPATFTTFVKDPLDRNITLDNLYALADAANVDVWTLFVPDFPFERTIGHKLDAISSDGYLLLHAFENAQPIVRHTLMELFANALCNSDKKAAHEIKEAQSKYLINK